MSDMASISDPESWPAIQKTLRNSQRYAAALEKIKAIAGDGSPIGTICKQALEGK